MDILQQATTAWSASPPRSTPRARVFKTAAPELRTFCKGYRQGNPSADLDLRLRQLGGLLPERPEDHLCRVLGHARRYVPARARPREITEH